MFIKVNIGIAPQFELIRRASSFWCLFCGFEPTVFCSDPVLPSWRETLSIYGPLTGALAAHNGFIALSCSPLNSVCITISLSLSLCEWFLSQFDSPATSLFSFRSGVLYVQSTYQWAFNLNRWRETNETNLASLQTISTDLPFLFFLPSVWLILFFLQWGSCEPTPAVISPLNCSLALAFSVS